MKVVVCPDKFRGCLTATEAAEAIAAGIMGTRSVDLRVRPLADGGEGTADALQHARGGQRHHVAAADAHGRALRTTWLALPDGTAVVESAASIGLALLEGSNDPLAASTGGLGLVLKHVLATKPRQLLVTVGGTATTDGGLGALEVLGWSLQGVPTTVLCDVDTPFEDAAEVFGPQKGADPDQVRLLTERLRRLADQFAREHVDVRVMPRAGAGGGLAGGLAALGASLRSGFDVVADAVNLNEDLDGATLVITGEGRLDRSSLSGKVVGGVLSRATGSVAVVAGTTDGHTANELRQRDIDVRVLDDQPDVDTFAQAAELLRAVGGDLSRGTLGRQVGND